MALCISVFTYLNTNIILFNTGRQVLLNIYYAVCIIILIIYF
jgi:hypothetical protein